MSIAAIQSALETRLLTLTPKLPIAWENSPAFTPAAGQPYQRVRHLLNIPIDRALTMDGTEDKGILQIDLYYPLGAGRVPAMDRAQAIRNHFTAPLVLPIAGAQVQIYKTPAIATAFPDEDRWRTVVSVYWRCLPTN